MKKPSVKLLLIIYIGMFAVGKIVEWGLSFITNGHQFAVGWLFGVIAALWYSSLVVKYIRESEGGNNG